MSPRVRPSPRAPARLPVVSETSAGGVVIRKIHGRWCVALLKTRHVRGEVWVLPKGHIEHHAGETKDVAAIREVREELGIAKVRVLRKLGTVRWQFLGEGDRGPRPARHPEAPQRRRTSSGCGREPTTQKVLVVKTVHHYLMEGLSERLRPQASEGFLEARWVPLAEARRLLAYPTDRSVVAKVRERA